MTFSVTCLGAFADEKTSGNSPACNIWQVYPGYMVRHGVINKIGESTSVWKELYEKEC